MVPAVHQAGCDADSCGSGGPLGTPPCPYSSSSALMASSCFSPQPPRQVPVPFYTPKDSGTTAVFSGPQHPLCPERSSWLFTTLRALFICSVREKQSQRGLLAMLFLLLGQLKL